MKKVLLIQGLIPHYRVPIFNELSKKVDLTVVYSYGKLPDNAEFKSLYIPIINLRYRLHKKNMLKFANQFDVVICMADFSYIYSHLMCILPRKYKLIFWGTGVAAGYDIKYDSNQTVAKRMLGFAKRANAMIFYCEYPVKKYSNMGIPKDKLFIANNTVEVLPIATQKKENILFVGSLYKQKKVDVLLENYLRAYNKNSNVPPLVLIGDGAEKETIENWIKDKNLQEKITLTGGIYDEKILSQYFAKALMCISPNQAGLSVLKSMGYGVPYVTHKDSVTGGELFNIHNNIDGFLIENFDELEDLILKSAQEPDVFITMGEKAKIHYDENRKISDMVKGFTDAIEFDMSK